MTLCLVMAKESGSVYAVGGAHVIDLLHGRVPQNGSLTLTKVERDDANLPDGIYYQPEDELDNGDMKELHVKVTMF